MTTLNDIYQLYNASKYSNDDCHTGVLCTSQNSTRNPLDASTCDLGCIMFFVIIGIFGALFLFSFFFCLWRARRSFEIAAHVLFDKVSPQKKKSDKDDVVPSTTNQKKDSNNNNHQDTTIIEMKPMGNSTKNNNNSTVTFASDDQQQQQQQSDKKSNEATPNASPLMPKGSATNAPDSENNNNNASAFDETENKQQQQQQPQESSAPPVATTTTTKDENNNNNNNNKGNDETCGEKCKVCCGNCNAGCASCCNSCCNSCWYDSDDDRYDEFGNPLPKKKKNPNPTGDPELDFLYDGTEINQESVVESNCLWANKTVVEHCKAFQVSPTACIAALKAARAYLFAHHALEQQEQQHEEKKEDQSSDSTNNNNNNNKTSSSQTGTPTNGATSVPAQENEQNLANDNNKNNTSSSPIIVDKEFDRIMILGAMAKVIRENLQVKNPLNDQIKSCFAYTIEKICENVEYIHDPQRQKNINNSNNNNENKNAEKNDSQENNNNNPNSTTEAQSPNDGEGSADYESTIFDFEKPPVDEHGNPLLVSSDEAHKSNNFNVVGRKYLTREELLTFQERLFASVASFGTLLAQMDIVECVIALDSIDITGETRFNGEVACLFTYILALREFDTPDRLSRASQFGWTPAEAATLETAIKHLKKHATSLEGRDTLNQEEFKVVYKATLEKGLWSQRLGIKHDAAPSVLRRLFVLADDTISIRRLLNSVSQSSDYENRSFVHHFTKATLTRTRYAKKLALYIPYLALFTFFLLFGVGYDEAYMLHLSTHQPFTWDKLTAADTSKFPTDCTPNCQFYTNYFMQFHEVAFVSDLTAWVKASLIPNIWPYPDAPASSFRFNGALPVGALKIRQVRSMPEYVKSRSDAYFWTKSPTTAETDAINTWFPTNRSKYPALGLVHPAYTQDTAWNEDAQDRDDIFGNASIDERLKDAFRYKTADQLNSSEYFLGKNIIFGSDGFCLVVPFSMKGSEATALITDLFDKTWVDMSTRGLMFELYFYNSQLHILHRIRLVFEVTAGGLYIPYMDGTANVVFNFGSHTYGFFIFLGVFALSLIAVILAGFRYFFWTVPRRGQARRREEGVLSYFHALGVDACRDPYGWLVVLNSIIQSIAWGIRVFQMTFTTEFLGNDVFQADYIPPSFATLASVQTASTYVSALAITIAYFIPLYYLTHQSSGLAVVKATLQRAAGPLLSLVIVSVMMLAAFAVCAFIAYGAVLPDYRNPAYALGQILLAVIGEYDYAEWRSVHLTFSAVFFFLMTVLLEILLLNMIVSILMDSFGEEFDEQFDETGAKLLIQNDPEVKLPFPTLRSQFRFSPFYNAYETMFSKVLVHFKHLIWTIENCINMKDRNRFVHPNFNKRRALEQIESHDHFLYWKYLNLAVESIQFGSLDESFGGQFHIATQLLPMIDEKFDDLAGVMLADEDDKNEEFLRGDSVNGFDDHNSTSNNNNNNNKNGKKLSGFQSQNSSVPVTSFSTVTLFTKPKGNDNNNNNNNNSGSIKKSPSAIADDVEVPQEQTGALKHKTLKARLLQDFGNVRTSLLLFQAMPNFHLLVPSSVLILNALETRHNWQREISTFTIRSDQDPALNPRQACLELEKLSREIDAAVITKSLCVVNNSNNTKQGGDDDNAQAETDVDTANKSGFFAAGSVRSKTILVRREMKQVLLPVVTQKQRNQLRGKLEPLMEGNAKVDGVTTQEFVNAWNALKIGMPKKKQTETFMKSASKKGGTVVAASPLKKQPEIGSDDDDDDDSNNKPKVLDVVDSANKKNENNNENNNNANDNNEGEKIIHLQTTASSESDNDDTAENNNNNGETAPEPTVHATNNNNNNNNNAENNNNAAASSSDKPRGLAGPSLSADVGSSSPSPTHDKKKSHQFKELLFANDVNNFRAQPEDFYDISEYVEGVPYIGRATMMAFLAECVHNWGERRKQALALRWSSHEVAKFLDAIRRSTYVDEETQEIKRRSNFDFSQVIVEEDLDGSINGGSGSGDDDNKIVIAEEFLIGWAAVLGSSSFPNSKTQYALVGTTYEEFFAAATKHPDQSAPFFDLFARFMARDSSLFFTTFGYIVFVILFTYFACANRGVQELVWFTEGTKEWYATQQYVFQSLDGGINSTTTGPNIVDSQFVNNNDIQNWIQFIKQMVIEQGAYLQPDTATAQWVGGTNQETPIGSLVIRQIRNSKGSCVGEMDPLTPVKKPDFTVRTDLALRADVLAPTCVDHSVKTDASYGDPNILAGKSAAIQKAFTYRSCEELRLVGTFETDFASIGCDGYALEIPFNINRTTASDMFMELINSGWIDEQTSILCANMHVFNFNLNFFARWRYYLQLTSGGAVVPEYDVNHVRPWIADEHPLSYKVFLGIFFATVLIQLFTTLKTMFLDIGRDVKITQSVFRSIFNVCTADVWWIINLTNVVILVVLWSWRYNIMLNSTDDIVIFRPEVSYRLEKLFNMNVYMDLIEAFCAILTFFRVAYYLRSFPSLNLLARTLFIATAEIGSLVVIFVVVFIGFGLAAFLVVGQVVFDFSTFDLALGTLFRSLLGAEVDFQSMIDLHPGWTGVYYTAFTIVCEFVLFNLIVAVLNDSLEKARNETADTSQFELALFQDSRIGNLLAYKEYDWLGPLRFIGVIFTEAKFWYQSMRNFIVSPCVDLATKERYWVQTTYHPETFWNTFQFCADSPNPLRAYMRWKELMRKDLFTSAGLIFEEEHAKENLNSNSNKKKAEDASAGHEISATTKHKLAKRISRQLPRSRPHPAVDYAAIQKAQQQQASAEFRNDSGSASSAFLRPQASVSFKAATAQRQQVLVPSSFTRILGDFDIAESYGESDDVVGSESSGFWESVEHNNNIRDNDDDDEYNQGSNASFGGEAQLTTGTVLRVRRVGEALYDRLGEISERALDLSIFASVVTSMPASLILTRMMQQRHIYLLERQDVEERNINEVVNLAKGIVRKLRSFVSGNDDSSATSAQKLRGDSTSDSSSSSSSSSDSDDENNNSNNKSRGKKNKKEKYIDSLDASDFDDDDVVPLFAASRQGTNRGVAKRMKQNAKAFWNGTMVRDEGERDFEAIPVSAPADAKERREINEARPELTFQALAHKIQHLVVDDDEIDTPVHLQHLNKNNNNNNNNDKKDDAAVATAANDNTTAATPTANNQQQEQVEVNTKNETTASVDANNHQQQQQEQEQVQPQEENKPSTPSAAAENHNQNNDGAEHTDGNENKNNNEPIVQ